MKKIAIITGADGGMGKEITRSLLRADYHVIGLCYALEAGRECLGKLAGETGNPDWEVLQVDLSSMKSIEEAVRTLSGSITSVDLLMNNAGMLASHFAVTEEGFENTVAVNYVAPYYLTRSLLPLMHAGSRIVNMVSCSYVEGRITPEFWSKGRKGKFKRIPVYSNTKLALWLFTRELSRRVADRGILVNAADPGIVNTEIIRMDRWFDCLTDLLFRPNIRTPEQGADMAVQLLLQPDYAAVTGGMFSSRRPKKVPARFLNPALMEKVWVETEKRLAAAGFPLDSGGQMLSDRR